MSGSVLRLKSPVLLLLYYSLRHTSLSTRYRPPANLGKQTDSKLHVTVPKRKNYIHALLVRLLKTKQVSHVLQKPRLLFIFAQTERQNLQKPTAVSEATLKLKPNPAAWILCHCRPISSRVSHLNNAACKLVKYHSQKPCVTRLLSVNDL